MSSKMRKIELLKAARTFRVATSATDAAIFEFLSALDTPRSLTVWLLYNTKEHDQLTELKINPDHYLNGYRFRDDYHATEFLSKANFLKCTFDRKSVALKKFHDAEKQCEAVNNRFRNLLLDPNYHGPNAWLLSATERKIAKILGDYCADELFDESNWGPGVSTLLKGAEVSAYNKFRDERGITRDLYSLLGPLIPEAYPSWERLRTASQSETLESAFSFEVGNTIVTVPKNSKTDRVIAVEPGFNLWFQKGVGSMIRRRLQRWGVDLNDQTRNQRLARKGSIDTSLATVDFSSASDTISKSVVEALLPPRWVQLMTCLRSPLGKLSDGSIIRWNKFSSMGNGFTFELESLIFFAAALAVCEYLKVDKSDVSVYGDDVIIPSECFELFSTFSDFLGFTVNAKKSFSSGNSHFRESCGSHFYGGIDCKPVFLKERLSHVETVFKLANGVRLLAHRCRRSDGCDGRFLACWRHLFERVPEPLRLKVPLQAGDTGFICNFDESCPARARYGIEGFYYHGLAQIGITQSGDGNAILLARLRSPSIREFNNSYTLRGRTRRALTSSLVSRWYNLGEWY